LGNGKINGDDLNMSTFVSPLRDHLLVLIKLSQATRILRLWPIPMEKRSASETWSAETNWFLKRSCRSALNYSARTVWR
jgi:hypothetical protein